MASEKLLCNKLTILTGLPRSGTTWTGKMIGSHPEVNYIFEPFSKKYHPQLPDSETCYNLAANYIAGEQALHNALYLNEAVFDEVSQFEEVFVRHLNALIKHYFSGSETKHLIIKTPKISKVQWFSKVFKPDYIIYIDRHLAAVVNSYIRVKRGISGWSEQEFSMLSQSISYTHPQFKDFVELPKNRVERATVVLALNRKIGLAYLTQKNNDFKFKLMEFEQTCQSIENTLKEVFDFLELDFNDEIMTQINNAVSSNRNQVKHLQIHNKDSLKKAYAWIDQMAPVDFSSFKRIHNALNLKLPLPGSELPKQMLSDAIKTNFQVIPRMIEVVLEHFNHWRSKNNLTFSALKGK
ncbi:MAG: sulfotransferase [Bacteroidetes bacterium]|nr:sulfotransferase [Bacteroidota bacterium]